MNFALSHSVKRKEAYVYLPVTTATPTFYPMQTTSIFNEVFGVYVELSDFFIIAFRVHLANKILI